VEETRRRRTRTSVSLRSTWRWRKGGRETADPIEVANRWIAAYNAKDFETLRSLMTDDIHVEHHNRGFALDGPDAVLEVITRFAEIVPDRRFHSTPAPVQ
jgi:hypothetical protein